MNLPNFITIMRLLLVPVIAIFLLQGKMDLAFVVFLLAGVSDALDGFLARILKQKTELGALLDPLADKLLLSTSFIFLAVINRLPSWLAVTVVSRDVIILGGVCVLMLFEKHPRILPSLASKITTFLQLATVLFFLGFNRVPALQPTQNILLFLTAFFTVLSGMHYIAMGLRYWGQNGSTPAVRPE